jgi:hypothetical protein
MILRKDSQMSVFLKIGRMHTAFSQLNPREYNAALDYMIGFCAAYVPEKKFDAFVAASIEAAKEPGAPRPVTISGKDAAAGPDK